MALFSQLRIICLKTTFILYIFLLTVSLVHCCEIDKSKSLESICESYKKKRFVQKELLGKGSFGTVYRVEDSQNTDKDFAMKTIKLNPKNTQMLSLEIQVGICFKDQPQLLGLQGCFILGNSNKGSIHLLTDRMKLSLSDVMMKNRLNLRQEMNYGSWKLRSMIEMAKGVKEMHDLNIIHRDLKTDNIMIGPSNKLKDVDVKLVDFGLSHQLNESGQVTGMVGTPYYMAPEISKKQPYGKPVDVFALGIVFYLFLRNEDIRLVYSQQHHRITLFIFDHIEKYQGLLQAMIKTNPSKRPTIEEVLEDLYRIQSKEESVYKQGKRKSYMSDLERCTTINQLNHEYIAKNKRFVKFSRKTFSGKNCDRVVQTAVKNGSFQQMLMQRQQGMMGQDQAPVQQNNYYAQRGNPRQNQNWAFGKNLLI